MLKPEGKSIFDKYPKLINAGVITFVVIILFGFVAVIVNLNIIKDYKGGESYSISDEFRWLNECRKSRFISLRERSRGADRVGTLNGQDYRMRTDSDGFIEPSAVHSDPDIKIFFVGGSTMECEYVDEEKRFPFLAAHLMEEKSGLKINGYNAGRSGNNSLHSINVIMNKILPYNPDMMVMMENVNDLSTLLYDGSYWNDNKSRSNLAGSKKKYSERAKYDEWADSKRKFEIFDEKEINRIKREFTENLELRIAISRIKHIIPVLMTQMNRIENVTDFDTGKGKEVTLQYQKLYTDFQNIIREVAAKNNIILVDLPATLGNDKKYFHDVVHLNNDGSTLVAKTIADKLEPCIKDINACKLKSK